MDTLTTELTDGTLRTCDDCGRVTDAGAYPDWPDGRCKDCHPPAVNRPPVVFTAGQVAAIITDDMRRQGYRARCLTCDPDFPGGVYVSGYTSARLHAERHGYPLGGRYALVKFETVR